MNVRTDFKCCWIGPTHGGLEWLRQRIGDFQLPGRRLSVIYDADSFEFDALLSLSHTGLDRLILGCSDRVSYPAREIAWLQKNLVDIPFAIATDNWWDGSRRTGIGIVDHLILPWYRWWDGWTDWLIGHQTHRFGPCQVPNWGADVVGIPDSIALSMRGVVVANCRQAGDAWALVARSLGAEATTMSARMFLTSEWSRRDGQVHWVLWDDSCLDTAQGEMADAQLFDCFALLRELHPETLGIAAIGLPRIDRWRQLARSGAHEFIVKPNSGQGLLSVLQHELMKSIGRIGGMSG